MKATCPPTMLAEIVKDTHAVAAVLQAAQKAGWRRTAARARQALTQMAQSHRVAIRGFWL